MLFNLTRAVLWLILSAFAVYRINTSGVKRKKLMSVSAVVLCMAVVSVTALFPVENLFIHSRSPESIFHYAGSGNIDEIIYGQESCLIVYSNGNSTGGHYIIPKTENGYKIPNYFTTKRISHKFDENGLFDIYHVNGTQDYYVFGTVDWNDTDNRIAVYNEIGEKVDTNIVRVENSGFIYFFLHNFAGEYYLQINGEIIPING